MEDSNHRDGDERGPFGGFGSVELDEVEADGGNGGEDVREGLVLEDSYEEGLASGGEGGGVVVEPS